MPLPPVRRRFLDDVAPSDDAAARYVLALLLAQDGSTTRLCEVVSGGPVQLDLLAQRVTSDVPDTVREVLPARAYIERVTSLVGNREVMMDNLSYIALDGLPPGMRDALEAGERPIGHLLAEHRVRRAPVSHGRDLLDRLWCDVGLPDPLASRCYRIDGTPGPIMVITETFRRGMLSGPPWSGRAP